ncbi:LuxR C-terminal-related transcriptional regulator [Marinibacterium sp. SX1]|uniref:LuxR C-terminal-related transcriptional regulator n=1 Tax=Marinibacterium sp. SX1 TaxID=3388424 RepID=UPI003D178ACB
MTLRIILCSDNALLRDLLADRLEQSGTARIVAAAEDLRDLAASCAGADVLLLDAGTNRDARRMHDVLAGHAQLRALVFGIDETSQAVLEFARAGAASILPRTSDLSDVIRAIDMVRRNEVHCPSPIGNILMRGLARGAQPVQEPGIDRLTPREREVARCLQLGLSNKEIARALRIEIATTKNHMHNLLAKLGVDSRAKAVAALTNLMECGPCHGAALLTAGPGRGAGSATSGAPPGRRRA